MAWLLAAMLVSTAADPAAVPERWRVVDEPADDLVVAPPEPLADCDARLGAAGIRWSEARVPVHPKGRGPGAILCGAEQVVKYKGSGAKIRWSSSPKVTCTMALALERFETIVQEEAERHLGRRVTRIGHIGTYACREMAAYPGWVSEHSYANAIDIASFELVGGREVSVLKDYGRADRVAPHARARFLRAVARRAFDDEVFAVVLTPAFDRAHRNHFHLDHARYRVDGASPAADDPPADPPA
jgi:hypothetical protein